MPGPESSASICLRRSASSEVSWMGLISGMFIFCNTPRGRFLRQVVVPLHFVASAVDCLCDLSYAASLRFSSAASRAFRRPAKRLGFDYWTTMLRNGRGVGDPRSEEHT